MKKLTIVIPSVNRKVTLRTTLEKLEKQTFPASEFEVILADDGSTDGTPEMIQSLIPSLPYTLRYVSNERVIGPGAAQNKGILAAQAEIILFLGDDIWATPELVEEHMKYHTENPDARVAVLGKIQQSPDLPQTVFLKHWDPCLLHRIEGKKEISYVCFFPINLSLKRSFLIEGGLFREGIGAANEDVEFGYRLSQRGMRFLYNEKALGYHHHVETLQSVCKRGYIRGLNWRILADNVPDPQMYATYKVFSLKAGFPTAGWLLVWHLVRSLCFNRFTVPYLFLPLLDKAETNSLCAAIAPPFYRRVLSYYFIKGISDARKQNQADAVQRFVEEDSKSKIARDERSRKSVG